MEKTNGSESTALARIEESPYEPANYREAMEMAKTFSDAKMTKARTPAQTFLVMATGHELGIPATTALRLIHVADFGQGDRPFVSAELMRALCLRATAKCEYFDFIEGSDKSATFETKRFGRPPQRETYTIEQAKQAGLWKKDGAWDKDPASQLIARSSSRLARRVHPDIVGGLYTADELEEAASAGVPLPVRPLQSQPQPAPQAQGGKVIDAEYTEPKAPAPSVADFEKRLRDATSKQEGDAIGREAAKIFDKGTPEREQLKAVMAERNAAAWATGEPPHDPKTGEVIETGAGG